MTPERINQDEQTIVVVPSMTVDIGDRRGATLQAYEERFLFLLLLLRQPRARLVYVTSQPILPSIVDYYLDLLPGVIPSHARKRLFLVSPLDGSARPLSAKLLERPRLIARIRELILDPERAHLVPFNTTELERDLALALGIPMYGADPKLFHFGTKTGCRRLFAEEGVAASARSRGPAVARRRGRRDRRAARREAPDLEQVLVKLNEGVVRRGQRERRPPRPPAPGSATSRATIEARVRAMSFESASVTFDGYVAKLEAMGGIVEERITGDEFRSPSVQLRVTPLGNVELLSTHDQVLGGPSGQAFIGCRFPGRPGLRAPDHGGGGKGRRAARGGRGHRPVRPRLRRRQRRTAAGSSYAIELNLRKGGTTHPFLTLQFLTDGTYDPETGGLHRAERTGRSTSSRATTSRIPRIAI